MKIWVYPTVLITLFAAMSYALYGMCQAFGAEQAIEFARKRELLPLPETLHPGHWTVLAYLMTSLFMYAECVRADPDSSEQEIFPLTISGMDHVANIGIPLLSLACFAEYFQHNSFISGWLLAALYLILAGVTVWKIWTWLTPAGPVDLKDVVADALKFVE